MQRKRSYIPIGGIFIIGALLFGLALSTYFPHRPIKQAFLYLDEKEDLTKLVESLCSVRAAALKSGDPKPIAPLFDTTQKFGKWALDHEVKRVKYLKDWAKERKIEFRNIEIKPTITKFYSSAKDSPSKKLLFYEIYKFDYVYPEDDYPVVNSFGARLVHVIEFKQKDGQWIVYKDWYLDCFEDAISAYTGEIPASSLATTFVVPKNQLSKEAKRYYNREKAVAYADKYCAIPWANGGSTKYNKKYKNYNGIGGDCTNYISQCLGDPEAGGLPMDGAWFSGAAKGGNNPGSQAWVNAGQFKNYLLYSGKGRQIARGTYKDLALPSEKNPTPPVSKLKLGDVISYEKKGKIDHSAIITGFDSHGYPLVNTHTVDRYRVPWDLGWGDNHIRFFLIHIN